jgi:DNA polymerase-3 subunit delta'
MFPWLHAKYTQLVNRYINKSLHHALLFSGPVGIGKQHLAETLAFDMLCNQPSPAGACGHCQSCHLRQAGNHPDYHVLKSEKQLGVDAIRTGITKLSGTAQMGGSKVLIIPYADSMTEAAANALLKTLEEPTNNTYLLLISDSLNRLMPTILSRCEKHTLSLPDTQSSLQYLKSQGIEDASEALLQAYGHGPLRVEAAMKSDDEFSYRSFSDGFGALLASSSGGGQKQQVLSLANKWQSHAVQVTQWCQQEAQKAYRSSNQSRDYARYQYCVDALRTLQHPGVNKSLVLVGVLQQFQC